MLLRVYNRNGKVSVVKVAANGYEQIMFSDIKDGETAEIQIDVSQFTKSYKKKTNAVSEKNRQIS